MTKPNIDKAGDGQSQDPVNFEDNELEIFDALELIPELSLKADKYHVTEMQLLEKILETSSQPGVLGIMDSIEDCIRKAALNTTYRLPETDDIASRIAEKMVPIIRERAIANLRNMPVVVEHRHIIFTGLKEYVESKTETLIEILVAVIIVLTTSVTSSLVCYWNSNAHWNAVRLELLESPLLTNKEREILTGKDFVLESEVASPLWYYSGDKREYLKRIEQIIEYRQLEKETKQHGN